MKNLLPLARRLVLYSWLPILALVLWWELPRAGSLYFPPLWVILDKFRQMWVFQMAGTDIAPSMEHLFGGFGLALVAGIAVGLAVRMIPSLYTASLPLITFLRGLPSPALIPPLILIFGLGAPFKIGIIALATVQPILLNTITGLDSIDEVQLETARSYGLSRWNRVTRMLLPAASPYIVAGARTGLQVAIIVMIASEILASSAGIGFQIITAQQNFDGPGMWSGMVLIGVIGILLNWLFILVERWVLRWYFGIRAREVSA